MDTPTNDKPNVAAIAIGLIAAVVSLVVAAALWATLGYVFAWKMGLSLGMILPPLAAGCAGGLIMRCCGRGLGPKTGWIALVFVLIGCIIGDVIWIMLAQQKSLGVLFGAELDRTMRTLTDLFKLFTYVMACYLTYTISKPPRVAESD